PSRIRDLHPLDNNEHSANFFLPVKFVFFRFVKKRTQCALLLMQGTHTVYKIFGSQWLIGHFCRFVKWWWLDRIVLRIAKHFIYVTVVAHGTEGPALKDNYSIQL